MRSPRPLRAHRISRATLELLGSVLILVLPPCSAFQTSVEETSTTILALDALQKAISSTIEADEVSLTLSEPGQLTVTIVNPRLDGARPAFLEEKATEIAVFSVDNWLGNLPVAFVVVEFVTRHESGFIGLERRIAYPFAGSDLQQ